MMTMTPMNAVVNATEENVTALAEAKRDLVCFVTLRRRLRTRNPRTRRRRREN